MAETGVDGWKSWKLAIIVGAPTVLGLGGLWYVKKKYFDEKKPVQETPKTEKSGSDTTDKPGETSEDKEVEQTPYQKAQSAKSKGNKYFKGQAYAKAIECYTEALSLCPAEQRSDISTYYQNRAAAHEQLKNYDAVVEDCTKALLYNDRYIKALHRRARALESIGGENLVACLEDITAVCILEAFQNQNSLMMAERVLKEVGKLKAKEAYKKRVPCDPSPQFVKTYFTAFANDPVLMAAEKPLWNSTDVNDDSDTSEKYTEEEPEKEISTKQPKVVEEKQLSPYEEAVQKLARKEYKDLIMLCTKEILEATTETHVPEALLLRSTMYLLRGEAEAAMEDFDRLLRTENIPKRLKSNALIKRGSLKMQHGNQTEALSDFAAAVREDPENSDIYHHRGQLNLLIDQVDDALRDFEKSLQLSPAFAIAHAQKCYTEYRQAMSHQSPLQLSNAMKEFEKIIEKFPSCSETYALYGQALCDQQQYDKADQNFQAASRLDEGNGNLDVHRGLLRLQWKQDIEAAANLIENALKRDEKCEFAYETLGTIEVQRGKLDKAVSLFKQAIALAKTEVEMVHLCSLLEAAMAQSRVAEKFGIQVPAMGTMGEGW